MCNIEDIKEGLKKIKAFDVGLSWVWHFVVSIGYAEAIVSWKSSVIPEKNYYREWRRLVHCRKADVKLKKLYELSKELGLTHHQTFEAFRQEMESGVYKNAGIMMS